jgi:hypothetical protein
MIALAACSSLQYISTQTFSAGSPTIAQVSAVDQRNEADPTWIGAIRGGYCNHLKELHLSGPLKETVATAFRDALKARGLLSSNGQAPFDLSITYTEVPELTGRQARNRSDDCN